MLSIRSTYDKITFVRDSSFSDQDLSNIMRLPLGSLMLRYVTTVVTGPLFSFPIVGESGYPEQLWMSIYPELKNSKQQRPITMTGNGVKNWVLNYINPKKTITGNVYLWVTKPITSKQDIKTFVTEINSYEDYYLKPRNVIAYKTFEYPKNVQRNNAEEERILKTILSEIVDRYQVSCETFPKTCTCSNANAQIEHNGILRIAELLSCIDTD